MRKLLTAWVTLAWYSRSAFDASEAARTTATRPILTVQVSSADHEIQEGYFTLGDSTTVMVKPGSDLYKFLARQRGRKVKIVLSEAGGAGALTPRAVRAGRTLPAS